MTFDEVVREFVRLAGAAGIPTLYLLLGIAVLAVVVVVVRKAKWPKMPPVSPDPEESNQSPPIPTANPRIPPDPGPM